MKNASYLANLASTCQVDTPTRNNYKNHVAQEQPRVLDVGHTDTINVIADLALDYPFQGLGREAKEYGEAKVDVKRVVGGRQGIGGISASGLA